MADDMEFCRVRMGDPVWTDVGRLRYQVYCREMKFLDPAWYPDGLECDEFDLRSVHFAAITREQQAVGTLRLVRDSALGFPLEQRAGSLALHDLPRRATAEISRLIVAKPYRQRVADSGRAYPLVLFGLFGRMLDESLASGVEHWLAAMEPRFRAFLSRFGVRFEPLGGPIEYHGQVVPYAARVDEVLEGMARMKPEALRVIAGRDLDAALRLRPAALAAL